MRPLGGVDVAGGSRAIPPRSASARINPITSADEPRRSDPRGGDKSGDARQKHKYFPRATSSNRYGVVPVPSSSLPTWRRRSRRLRQTRPRKSYLLRVNRTDDFGGDQDEYCYPWRAVGPNGLSDRLHYGPRPPPAPPTRPASNPRRFSLRSYETGVAQYLPAVGFTVLS